MKIAHWTYLKERLTTIERYFGCSIIYEFEEKPTTESYIWMGKLRSYMLEVTAILEGLELKREAIIDFNNGVYASKCYLADIEELGEGSDQQYKDEDVYNDLEFEFPIHTLLITHGLTDFISHFDEVDEHFRKLYIPKPDAAAFGLTDRLTDAELEERIKEWQEEEDRGAIMALEITYGMNTFMRNMNRAYEIIQNKEDLSEILTLL